MKFIRILLFAPFLLKAQIPPGYYNPVNGLTGNNLRVGLYNIIKNHTIVPYSGLWQSFISTDQKANGKVWDIYSHVPAGSQPYEYTFVTHQCGSYNSEADCYNREHSWPQSWFNSQTGPDSDLFHIYPTDGYVNNQRSNFPFGNVGTANWTSANGSKLGLCIDPGYNQTVFEPIDAYKGDLARSFFYMTTRYYSEDGAWSSSGATNKAEILAWQLTVLLDWHHQDPVSAKEIARNDSVYKLQNNRNPFIDHPEFADSIWLAVTSVFENEELEKRAFSIAPNPACDFFTVTSKRGTGENITCEVRTLTGQLLQYADVDTSEDIKIDCAQWAEGVYLVSVSDGKYTAHFRLVK